MLPLPSEGEGRGEGDIQMKILKVFRTKALAPWSLHGAHFHSGLVPFSEFVRIGTLQAHQPFDDKLLSYAKLYS